MASVLVGAGDALDGSAPTPIGPSVAGSRVVGWVARAVALTVAAIIVSARWALARQGALVDAATFGMAVAAAFLWWGPPGALAAAALGLQLMHRAPPPAVG